MILLFIFILGCFVTSIVAVGLLFALAAVGYGDEYKSDGTALAALQIPAVQIARYGGTTGYLHSTRDDIEHLAPEAFQKVGEFCERFLVRYVARASAFPFAREIPDDQMKKIKKFFNQGLKTTPPGEKEKVKKTQKRGMK